MLSSDEISSMQAAVNAALPSTGTVKRVSRASDSMGGFTETWTTVTATACRVDPAVSSQVLQMYAARLGERQATVINFPYGTDIQEGDEVTIGLVVYEVLGILSGSWELVRQAVAVRHA